MNTPIHTHTNIPIHIHTNIPIHTHINTPIHTHINTPIHTQAIHGSWIYTGIKQNAKPIADVFMVMLTQSSVLVHHTGIPSQYRYALLGFRLTVYRRTGYVSQMMVWEPTFPSRSQV